MQVPSAAAPREALQTSQPPLQGALQQTPSEQLPEPHWLPAVQAVPRLCAPAQVPPTQLPEAHWDGRLHALPAPSFCLHVLTSQKAAVLQSLSWLQLTAHAGEFPEHRLAPQSPSGSVPAAAGVQVPTEGGRLHRSQARVQAPVQHTPSTQKPEAHAVPALHGVPGGLPGVHFPPAQEAPGAHPLLTVQAVVQAPPAPQSPGAHEGEPGLPAGTVPHVPALPGRLHASQAPAQAELQQVPSAQCPEAQSPSAAHEAPRGNWATQLPASQEAPATHPAAAVQACVHPPSAPQAYAPQDKTSGAPPASVTHLPAALQVRQGPVHTASQQTPSAQLPDSQLEPDAHADPSG